MIIFVSSKYSDMINQEQVKELGLQEIAKLRAGDFDEDLIKAAVANFQV